MSQQAGNGPRGGQTDFGRQMIGSTALSLGEALRDRAWRMARTEAYRFHVAMGLVGFVGGLVAVVPIAMWLASLQHARTTTLPAPAGLSTAMGADATRKPPLVSAPTLANREPLPAPAPIRPTREKQVGSTSAGQAESFEAARALIRNGRIAVARELLSRDELVETGEAAFMLAETYDPNVLAALGVDGVPADAETARRHYDAALAKGITAAAQRLDALE